MIKDKAIKITQEGYNKIVKLNKTTKIPIKYLVEMAIDLFIEKNKKNN